MRAWLERVAYELFSIRTRLLLVNVLIVAVPLIGIGFARFYEREMLRNLEDDMIHQAEILRQLLVADPEGLQLVQREPVLTSAARRTRTRIRLLGPSGELQADSHRGGPPEGPEEPAPSLLRRSGDVWEGRSHHEPPEPQDVSKRPEVLEALRGSYGATTRLWKNGDRLYMFSALPIVKGGNVQGVVYVTRSTNPVRAAMYRLRTKLLLVLAASIAATMVLSIFLARTISRPLTRLTRVAERIASGDRSQQLKLARRDEIGQLARAFDTMTRKLDERAGYIAQLSANISHEFKSPLTSIRGAAELLKEGAADDAQARDLFLTNILVDAHRLDRLVTRLLELSRVEADPVPSEVVDYEALVREVAEQSRGASPIKVIYEASHKRLLARKAHLASALGNLIDNAQHHAFEGTTVEVHVTNAARDIVRTTVRNEGPVISTANLDRVWERFFTTRAAGGGTGLGLPIVASVVAAHGGTVSVTSRDEGTAFSYDLPVSRG